MLDYDLVNNMIAEKKYAAAQTLITAEKKRLEEEYNKDTQYWCNAGSMDHSMADYCDNEVLASSRGLADSYKPLEKLEKKITEAIKIQKQNTK